MQVKQTSRRKTKEMIFGALINNPPSPLVIGNESIQRVTSFKLLGVHLTNKLQWDCHVNAICSKTSSRLYFLKQLKRSGLPTHDLLYFYLSTIRPVLEYACVLWHHGLTKWQSDQIEAIQKRALRIVSNVVHGMQYTLFTRSCFDLPSLHQRREDMSRDFFQQICQPDNCLHHLLPPPRNTEYIGHLRHPSKYPRPLTRTKRYCSFIQHALSHYQ